MRQSATLHAWSRDTQEKQKTDEYPHQRNWQFTELQNTTQS